MAWPVFWTETTGEVALRLRRLVLSAEDRRDCPGGGYHSAMSPELGRFPARYTLDGHLDVWPPEDFAGDERWPTTCEHCPYVFAADDYWQVWQAAIYRRPDSGEEWPQRSLPVGAMFDATWAPDAWRGNDGIALTVVLPPPSDDAAPRFWNVDGPAGGKLEKPRAWTRTGDPRAQPPNLDVNPSILTPDYHGFLRHGFLSDSI